MRFYIDNRCPSPQHKHHPKFGQLRLKGDYGLARTASTRSTTRSGLSSHSNRSSARIALAPVKDTQKCVDSTRSEENSDRTAVENRPVNHMGTGKEVAPPKMDKKTASATGEKRALTKKTAAAALAIKAKRDEAERFASKVGKAAPDVQKPVKTKSSERPYECMIEKPWGCLAAFKTDDDRKRHMNTHFALEGKTGPEAAIKITGVAWGFKCLGCNSRYSRKEGLIKHTDRSDQEQCKRSLNTITGEERAWTTEKGCQYLHLPPPGDPLRIIVRDLWKTHGQPAHAKI